MQKQMYTCSGGNDGAIYVHGVNGIAPYTYMWNDGVTTEDRTNLTAGTYTVTVTDSQGSTAI